MNKQDKARSSFFHRNIFSLLLDVKVYCGLLKSWAGVLYEYLNCFVSVKFVGKR